MGNGLRKHIGAISYGQNDNSPCSFYLKNYLKDANASVQVHDTVEFLVELIKDIKLEPMDETVYAHPVCSVEKMGITDQFYEVVRHCSKNVVTPAKPTCCGTAGDKGFRYSQFSQFAAQKAIQFSDKKFPNVGVSSSLTCELGLSQASELKFTNLLALFSRAASLTP